MSVSHAARPKVNWIWDTPARGRSTEYSGVRLAFNALDWFGARVLGDISVWRWLRLVDLPTNAQPNADASTQLRYAPSTLVVSSS